MALSRSARQYMGVRAITPPDLQYADRDPTSNDKAYVKGTLWLNLTGRTVWMWPGVGTWVPLGSGDTDGFVVASGESTLVAGTVTIPNTDIEATDIVELSRNALNASPALGHLIYTITPGVSIAVTSYSAAGAAATTDVSGFTYTVVRPL